MSESRPSSSGYQPSTGESRESQKSSKQYEYNSKDIGDVRSQVMQELYGELYEEIKQEVRQEIQKEKPEIIRKVKVKIREKLEEDLKRNFIQGRGEDR